jgi:hypothetical protein
VVLGLVMVPGASAAPRSEPDLVQVFFSRNPESLNDFAAVFPIERFVLGGPDLIEQTVAALIAGPTPAEQAMGYFSDFSAIQVGASTCKAQDFTLIRAGGTVTLQLCRATSSAGIGQDARAQNEINATVMQFPGITRVIVLTSAGHCLFDESGMDLCLAP